MTRANPSSLACCAWLLSGRRLHANQLHPRLDGPQAGTELEATSISPVWGTGDVSEKPAGFTMSASSGDGMRRVPQREIDALIAHVTKWSPVANTLRAR